MPDTRVHLRPARSGDREQVWPLARAFATSFTPNRDAFDATWATLIAAPDTLLAVADSPTHGVLGYLLATSHPTFLANGPVGWVEEVTVAPDHRRRGIGRHLIATAETWARTTGCAYLALATRRAGDFYRALDYEASATFYKKNLT